MTPTTTDVVRELLSAFHRADREAFEALLAPGFTFSTPDDPRLDTAGFFERCWPGARLARSYRIERLFAEGDEAFVLYEAEFMGRPPFKNTEHVVVEGGKVKRVEVYYGTVLGGAED